MVCSVDRTVVVVSLMFRVAVNIVHAVVWIARAAF